MTLLARLRGAAPLGLAAAIIGGVSLAGQVKDPAAAKIANPVPSNPESLGAGKRAYDTNCAACHGNLAQGAQKAGVVISIIAEQGGRQPPDLTDDQWDHGSTDGEIFTVIKRGVPPTMMAGWDGRVSDTEIWSIVNYLRALASKKEITTAPLAASDPVAEHTLALSDYVQMPITGEPAGDLTRGLLARVNFLRDEPGGRRFFVNDLNGPLYILDKQTKRFTTYLDFNGLNGRPGLFPKLTFERNFATGLINFVFDPDYARNGVFYTLHMQRGPARLEGSDEVVLSQERVGDGPVLEAQVADGDSGLGSFLRRERTCLNRASRHQHVREERELTAPCGERDFVGAGDLAQEGFHPRRARSRRSIV